jgi:prepilin-type N-terminal cleavage/methylation domain-containing protein
MRKLKTARRGFTLIEVVISVSILSVLILAAMQLLVSTQKVTVSTAVQFDLDEEGRKAIRLLRKEIRMSGWDTGEDPDADYMTVTSAAQIDFRKRINFSSPADVNVDWTPVITIQAVADGTYSGVAGSPTRYRLEKTGVVAGVTEVIANDLLSNAIFVELDDHTIGVTLQFARPQPIWEGSSAPAPMTRRFSEKIRMMNRN